MATYIPPKRATAYVFYTALTSTADTMLLQANPTLAAGDVKISKDGGAFANPDTLPDVDPDAGYAVKVSLTGTEMTADTVTVYFHDASGGEWCDQFIAIQTTAAQIDDLARTGADSDTLETLSDQMDTMLTGITLNTLIISPVGGTTDSDGAADGTTLLDSSRAEATDHWNGLSVEITSGDYLGQTRTIEGFVNGVGFSFAANQAFGGQIVSGVTYRVISAIVYQPGLTVVKNFPTTVEPDTSCLMGIAIVTNAGQPSIANLTVGTITINRIRAGASTPIVAGAACVAAIGNIFYSYTFPSADWQAGDLYQAILIGQKVAVNGITYDLSMVILDGRVTREAAIQTDTAAILLDTGTNGVVLANDAITAAKYDESTAYPLTAADAGATEVARTGADADTLETLSDQSDLIYALLQQADVQVVSAAAGDDFDVYRYTTWSITQTVTGDLTGASLLWFSIKEGVQDDDDAALLRIEKTAKMIRWNKAEVAAGDETLGTMAVTYDGGTGKSTIVVTVSKTITGALAAMPDIAWDLKKDVTGVATPVVIGTCSIKDIVTRAVV